MARIIEQEYRERVPLTEVQPHPKNPNKGDVGAIAESIEENGFYGVVLVQKSTNYIVAGEHRWRAAGEEGLDAIPMVFANLDDATALRIMAGDNRLADLREYNRDKLAELLQEMATEAEHGLKGTGYTEQDMTALLEQMANDVLAQGGADAYGMTPGEGEGMPGQPYQGQPSGMPGMGQPGQQPPALGAGVPSLTPLPGGKSAEPVKGSLNDQFIVPPFSVLDARQGYWQTRKRAWLALGIRSELGRGEMGLAAPVGGGGLSDQLAPRKVTGLLGYSGQANDMARYDKAGYLARLGNGSGNGVDTNSFKAQNRLTALQKTGDSRAVSKGIGPRPGGSGASEPGREAGEYTGGDAWMQGAPQSGTSIFDPVLTELAYRWFSPQEGSILDPFAGGSVRGIVAAKLGRHYTGIELRPEQVAANREQAREILRGVPVPALGPMAAPVATTGDDEPLPMALPALMSGFAPVRPEDVQRFAHYYTGFAATRRYPRHYMAPLRLAAGGNDFLWRVVGGCLCVVKRKWVLGNPVLYLILPPMHPAGNVQREREVLEAFRSLGVSARLSPEDMALYGYAVGADCEVDGTNAEYIYRAGDFADEAMAAPERKKDRYHWNRMCRQVAAGELLLERYAGGVLPEADALEACAAVNAAWHRHKGKASVGRDVVRYVNEYPAFAKVSPYISLLHVLRSASGVPAAYTIGEQVGEAWAVLGVGYHDYDQGTLLGDAGRVLHTLDAQAWAERLGPGTLLNLGASVGIEGLAATKVKLHPVGTLQLYRLLTPVKLTADMWKAAKPEAEPVPAPAVAAPVAMVPEVTTPEAEASTDLVADPPSQGDYMPEQTAIETHGGYLVKRDDTYRVAGVAGGKVRSCWHLAQGAPGLITAGSRHSPQVNIVAHIAARLGIPCRVHVPSGELSPELLAAQAMGAEVVQHRPGYNSVIVARARTDAQASGWREIPFGMECAEAVKQTASQVASLRGLPVSRIVVPVGSGMSLSGILHGLRAAGLSIPVVGVRVGADPTKRLDKYAPEGWRSMATLVDCPLDYSQHASVTRLGDLSLDPVYEAKCLPFLQPGDLLWIVGIRQTAGAQGEGEQVAPSRAVVADTVAEAAQAAPSKPEPQPTWVEGDSRNLPTLLPEGEQYDLVFTCPPYYDLEVYSDNPADLSTAGTYAEFLASYREIIARAVARLKPNRFAACVVGDIRDAKGFYCNFVADTIAAFEAAGARLYNEAVLVTAVGSLPVRSGRIFKASRKLGKSHQNVLVFCKGDPSLAAEACGDIDVTLPEGMGEQGTEGEGATGEGAA